MRSRSPASSSSVLAPNSGQAVAVERRPRALHDGKHRHQRQVDVEVRARAAIPLQRLSERFHQLARGGGAHDGAFLVRLRVGQHAAAVRVQKRIEGILRHRRVQHVAGQAQVEGAHRHEVVVGDQRGHGGVGGIDPVQRLLHVERRERAAFDHARQDRKAFLLFEGRRALRGAERRDHPRAEQGHLLGLHERHAHRLARLDGRFHERSRLVAMHDGLPRERRLRLLQLLAHQLEDASQMSVELDLLERLHHLLLFERGEGRRLQVEREVEVAHDGGHLSAGERGVLVVADALELLAFERVQVLVEAFERPVLLQQLGRGLLADAGHAGDVVGRVALEPQEVGHLRRRDAVALRHLGRAVDGHVGDAFLRGDDARLVAGQLVGVLVARHQQRLVAQLLVAPGHGAQDVVAFPSLHAHDRHVHGLQQLLDDGELHLQVVVHGRTLCLVLLEGLRAERRAACVERADDGIGVRDVDELEQHGDEAEHGVGGPSVRRVHGLGHGVIGAVHERVAVDDGNLFRHRASSVDRYRERPV